MLKSYVLSAALLVMLSLHAGAAQFAGKKQIILLGNDKEQVVIGSLDVKREGDGWSFSVKLDADKFTDHFLSMRPFQCIEHVKQTICHLVYPYKTRKRFNIKDLTDLEYELLFLHKKKSEYGIDPWNGIYYKLKAQSNGTITGQLHEADMNKLASPPAKDYDRPISDPDLTPGEPSQYRFPRLIIR